MKVIVVDQDREGTLGWYCAREFRRLGHEVLTADIEKAPAPSRAARQSVRSLVARNVPGLVRRVVAGRNRELVSLVRAAKPDLVLVLKGRLVLPESLEAIRGLPGRPFVANWYPDPDMNLRSFDVLRGLRAYDAFFVKEKNLIRHLRQIGVDVWYLPHCSDPEVHRPVEPTEHDSSRFGCDALFAGNMYAFKAECLAALAGEDLKVFGQGWERLPPGHPLLPHLAGDPLYGEDLTRAYSAARVIINVHDHVECWGLNDRTFHAAACGCCQLVDDRPDLAEFFEPGTDVAVYATPEEMRRKLKELVLLENERAEMGRRARAKLLARHTFRHRVLEILDVAARPSGG